MVTQSVSGATTWTDVALEVGGVKVGLVHSTSTNNEQITIGQTGRYLIAYTVGADSSSGTSILEARVVKDGTEIAGSTVGTTLGASDQKPISTSFMVDLTLNEVIELQIYSDTANGRIVYPGSGATDAMTAMINISQIIK